MRSVYLFLLGCVLPGLGGAIGSMLGFLAAAAVAVHTLSSPIGPVASTLLAGAGAVLGARGLRSRPLLPR